MSYGFDESDYRRFLAENFSLTEIKILCHDLKVDFEKLLGEEKELKALELVRYLARREKLDELDSAFQRLRPNIYAQWVAPLPLDMALSQRVGINKEVQAQIEKEGEFFRLAVGSCVELHYKELGWPKEILDINVVAPSLDPQINEIITHIPASIDARPKYCLSSLEPELSDDLRCHIKLSIVGWDIIRKTHENFELIQNVIPDLKIFRLNESQIPNMLVVHLVLVTADDYLLLCQRSDRPYYYKHHWSVSAEEQMSDQDDLDLYRAAQRGIKEEILSGIPIDEDNIAFVSFFREFDRVWNRDLGRYTRNGLKLSRSLTS